MVAGERSETPRVFELQVRALTALTAISSLLLIHHLAFVVRFVNEHSACFLRHPDVATEAALGAFVARVLAVYTEMRDINKAFACVLDTDLPDLPRLYAGPAVESALCGLAQQILPLQLPSVLALLREYAVKDAWGWRESVRRSCPGVAHTALSYLHCLMTSAKLTEANVQSVQRFTGALRQVASLPRPITPSPSAPSSSGASPPPPQAKAKAKTASRRTRRVGVGR